MLPHIIYPPPLKTKASRLCFGLCFNVADTWWIYSDRKASRETERPLYPPTVALALHKDVRAGGL